MTNDKYILHLEKRRQIYGFINKNPGLHLRELSRRINIPKTTLKYHIKYLKKIGLIKEICVEKYKRLFVCDEVYTRDKVFFSFIRKEIPLRIFIYLCFAVSFSQVELAKELDVKYQSLRQYIKKMLELGVIEEAHVVDGVIYLHSVTTSVLDRKPVGSEKIYTYNDIGTSNIIERVLIANKDSLVDKMIIDSYIHWYKQVKDDKLKKVLSADSHINNVIELFEDIFSPFFCA